MITVMEMIKTVEYKKVLTMLFYIPIKFSSKMQTFNEKITSLSQRKQINIINIYIVIKSIEITQITDNDRLKKHQSLYKKSKQINKNKNWDEFKTNILIIKWLLITNASVINIVLHNI